MTLAASGRKAGRLNSCMSDLVIAAMELYDCCLLPQSSDIFDLYVGLAQSLKASLCSFKCVLASNRVNMSCAIEQKSYKEVKWIGVACIHPVGAAKKGPGWQSPKTRSRICKAVLWDLYTQLAARIGRSGEALAESSKDAEEAMRFAQKYEQTKAMTRYRRDWQLLLQQPSIFEAWIPKSQGSGQTATS